MICTVEFTVAQRGCNCQICGDRMEKGEQRITYSTPTQKARHAHIGCYKKMSDGYVQSHSINDNHEAKDTKPHTVLVIAKKDECGYFGQYGFAVKPHNAQLRKFETIEVQKNRHTSGHIVSRALSEGYKVFVNGEEVKTFEQFRRMTDR